MRLAAALLWLAAPAAAQLAPVPSAPAAVQSQTIRAVRAGVYMVTGAGGNVTVWVADHGLVLVDDKLAGDANFANLVAAIRSVSQKQVLAVFNTHHHADHIGNNARFLAANVMVIGTDGLADQLARAPVSTGDMPAAPDILFSRDFSLVLVRGRVDAHHYGPGHTAGDAVIYFPAAGVVAAGDLLNARTPTFDYAGGATIAGWLRSLDAILALPFEAAVPGHGDAPMSRAEVEAFRARLATFFDRARATVRGGAGEARLIEGIRTDDLGWTWSPTSWSPARRHGLWLEAGGKG